jgi:hypothetical protein
MSLPTTRLTITVAEYRLLKQGLDVLACGLAETKLGLYPHRHPWDRIDLVASDVYRERKDDAEMSARIIGVRAKLWDLTRSRKVYVDAFELAALAFALRLVRSRKLVDITLAVSIDMKLLATKIEAYRKRVKRLAIAKIGALEYQSIAGRWRRNVAWLRYNTLYTKLPKNTRPGRAQRWRDQRQQATQAIKTALAESFYEALDDKQMARIVTLLTTTLRRCRRAVGLVDFLLDPHAHSDLLIKFVVKRIELDRLPGAPKPAWQAASDRADKFKEYQESSIGKIAQPSDASSGAIIAVEQEQKMVVPAKAKAPQRYTHHREALTGEILIDAMAEWLYAKSASRRGFRL